MKASIVLLLLGAVVVCLLQAAHASSDCQHSDTLGVEYSGAVSKTKSGRRCQPWAKKSPHRHSQSADNMPEESVEEAENYCRNPDLESGGVWCYTTDPSKRWEYCDVPTCQEQCQNSDNLGLEYSGTASKTKSGKICQPWVKQSPHKHSQSANNMPEDSLKEAENFCRNPDKESGGVWCYTSDPSKRWEYCDVPACQDQCQNSNTLGSDYAGPVSKTKSGKTCQPWAKTSPHKHSQSAENMPEDSLEEAENYCRNPDLESGGVWCYTTDPSKRWEYCDVSTCADQCQNSDTLGTDYSGSASKTKSGKTCQAWAKKSPHRHGQSANNMPEESLEEAENFCRNPDKESGGVWCYTTDPSKRWEYCDVPKC